MSQYVPIICFSIPYTHHDFYHQGILGKPPPMGGSGSESQIARRERRALDEVLLDALGSMGFEPLQPENTVEIESSFNGIRTLNRI